MTDKLSAILLPYVGFINVKYEGQSKPNNGTGVIVTAPDAPNGAVVITAKHVATVADGKCKHSIIIHGKNGFSETKSYRIIPYSFHARLDLASFTFEDHDPLNK